MKISKSLTVSVAAALVMLALAVGLTQAQGPGPENEVRPQSEADVTSRVSNVIPIQGRLTDSSGNPLDGTYAITATLYDASSGGTLLCQDDDNVTVDNGLFNMKMDFCSASDIDGKQLYLGIQVESDPAQVPYTSNLR